jgi:nucleotide-binding universal stress UspA family protein
LNTNNSNKVVFKKAIVAAAFSPRLHAVMNQAHYMLKLLGTWPVIVHVGEETHATRTRLEEEIDRTHFKKHPPICLVRSGQPADVLSQVAKEQNADLIVAGALTKEHGFKYYLGSVARNLARSAPCSVLLFSDPLVKPHPISRIHCAVAYDKEEELAVRISAELAFWSSAKDLYFTHSFKKPEWQDKKSSPSDPTEFKKAYQVEDKKLQEFLSKLDFIDKEYTARSLYEKNRSVTLSFTREVKADMLVVPGPKSQLGLWDRLFPHDIELALQNLPCSLLITKHPDRY